MSSGQRLFPHFVDYLFTLLIILLQRSILNSTYKHTHTYDFTYIYIYYYLIVFIIFPVFCSSLQKVLVHTDTLKSFTQAFF